MAPVHASVPTGTLHVSHLGTTTVVRLRGEHDIATAPELRQLLLTPLTARTVVVDLAECQFLDGSIIGVLVGAHSRLARHGRRLITTNASGQPERTLAIVQSSLNFEVRRAADHRSGAVRPGCAPWSLGRSGELHGIA